MKTKRLTAVLERMENWPAEWQEKLADIALDIGAGLKVVSITERRKNLKGSIAA